jgi:hypothetical protein
MCDFVKEWYFWAGLHRITDNEDDMKTLKKKKTACRLDKSFTRSPWCLNVCWAHAFLRVIIFCLFFFYKFLSQNKCATVVVVVAVVVVNVLINKHIYFEIQNNELHGAEAFLRS